MAENTSADKEPLVEDPVYRNCVRESRFILGLWLCCFFYTVTYCYCRGYLSHEPLSSSTGPGVAELFGPMTSFNRQPDSLTYPLGLGIPDWVFYGIVLPWCACILMSLWFCMFMFVEDDLAEPEQEKDAS